LIELFDFSPDKSRNINHNLNRKYLKNVQNNCIFLTAISIGLGGGPRLSFVSTSRPDNILAKSIRNETTKSKTRKNEILQ
jgi:hypothetical protein